MAIIGIDLGTTNSLAAVWRSGASELIPNSLGSFLTPSAVSLAEDGTVLVGSVARERLVSHPDRSAAGFKRYMGQERPYLLGGKPFSPEDLSALVLRQLKRDAEAFLGEEVEEAVVSVPAYFNDRQRSATKRAGALAGLRVDRLVNEPSAAALSCRMQGDGEDRKFLVFDFGGGTLDVSVVDCFDNVVSIVAVSGDNHLGGTDFDREIAQYFCRENGLAFAALTPVQRAVLLGQAEQCKMALSARDPVMALVTGEGMNGSMTLTNRKLIECCADLLRRCVDPVRRALADSGTSLGEIDDVVLVGGSCRMPAVRMYLEHLLHRRIGQAANPETVVALGVGTYAGMKARKEHLRDMLLTDICPFTLGTAIYNHEDPSRSLMSPIIERNSVLPTSKSQRYYTVRDLQTTLSVEIFQGEGYYCEDNLLLGEVSIEVPPAPHGEQSIDVRFTYDINGILEVEVTSSGTGRTQRKVLVEKNSGMSQEEIARRLAELQELKTHPRDQDENLLVIARAERLYRETLGDMRENVGRMLSWFQGVLKSQEPTRIAHARAQANDFLERMENRQSFFDPSPFEFDEDDEE